MNSQRVPIILPEIRGMRSWSADALTQAVLGDRPGAEGPEQTLWDQQAEGITDFLDRVYYELANMGTSPPERAVNYAATNLYQVATVFGDAVADELSLDKIEVERSPLCRPNSDCWDVKLSLFNPKQRQERARDIYRLTVDVSEVLPVTIGRLRKWAAY
jgi:hypothetical protein